MHMEITPNRQSLPRRFISLNRVATQRAPSTEKNRLVKLVADLQLRLCFSKLTELLKS